MSFTVSFRKRFFRLFVVITVGACLSPSLGLAATQSVTGTYTISASTATNLYDNDLQSIDADGTNLTVNSGFTVNRNGNNAVKTNDNDNITIINNSGSVISTTAAGANNGNNAINAGSSDTLIITNSGRISAGKESAIQFSSASNINITNNSGGEIWSHQDTIDGNSTNLTVTNSGKIYITTAGTHTSRVPSGAAMDLSGSTNATITNNSGGEIYTDVNDGGGGSTINMGASSSITNSGQIRDDSSQNFTMDFSGNNTTFTNNSGGSVTGGEIRISNTITGITITNSGTMSSAATTSTLEGRSDATGTITNNAGGVISNSSTGNAVQLGVSSTLTNSGTIQNTASTSNSAINFAGNNNTVILKNQGKVIGLITADAGTTGNKLQLQHGFGRTYFYETSGDFTLEDLSGNKVVKGSAGSVSLGGQETVDELLGLRTYNLRSSLKRYASAPKPSDKNMVWGETFGYSSKRGGNETLLKYDTYGYGMNFIYPVTSKLDLILSVERNELGFPEDYEVSRTGFLAGVNVSEFSGFGRGNWKAGGFAVAGMGWNRSEREILTNTTASGLLDVTADYKSMEVLTGVHINHTYQSLSKGWMKNKWETEIGLTIQGSRTGDYNERHYFFFEERTLLQNSFYIGEQLTSTFNDRLGVTLGVDLEHRLAFSGQTQTYRINGTPTDYIGGSFSENSASANLGLNYSFIDHKPGCNVYEEFCGGSLYIQLNSRLSDETRGTYGGGIGVRLNF